VYVALDQAGKLGALWEDVIKRPYITIGMLGFVLLIPLAVTSTTNMQRRLGRRWVKLHQLIYVVALLGVWHFWWQVKKDIREPLIYAAILAILLGYRLYKRRKRLFRFSPA
jgi:sulfoxide reductase heme-binding subunit YedZ